MSKQTPAQRVGMTQLGEKFVGERLVGNVSPDPIEAKVTAVSSNGVVTFGVTYLGIKMASAACKVQGDKQIWTEAR